MVGGVDMVGGVEMVGGAGSGCFATVGSGGFATLGSGGFATVGSGCFAPVGAVGAVCGSGSFASAQPVAAAAVALYTMSLPTVPTSVTDCAWGHSNDIAARNPPSNFCIFAMSLNSLAELARNTMPAFALHQTLLSGTTA